MMIQPSWDVTGAMSRAPSARSVWDSPALAAVSVQADRLQLALKAARIGVFDVHLLQGQRYYTDECLDVLGYGPEYQEAFQLGWIPLAHPEDRPEVLRNRLRVRSCKSAGWEEEVRRMRHDGSYGWVRSVCEVVERDAAGFATRLVGTLEDVDARHRAEAELRCARAQIQALSAHVEEHLEAERKLIAAEVHDQCGQVLTLVKMEIAEMRTAAREDPRLADGVRRVDGMVNELVRLSRNVISRLRPPALDLGLVPALEWLTEEWSRQTGMACEFSTSLDDLPLPDGQTLTLFRLVQESLTNAARHAQASWVHVGVAVHGDWLDLRVADNGRGFDVNGNHAGHFGLLGMRERAQRVGARLELVSALGAGTEVRVSLPLAAHG